MSQQHVSVVAWNWQSKQPWEKGVLGFYQRPYKKDERNPTHWIAKWRSYLTTVETLVNTFVFFPGGSSWEYQQLCSWSNRQQLVASVDVGTNSLSLMLCKCNKNVPKSAPLNQSSKFKPLCAVWYVNMLTCRWQLFYVWCTDMNFFHVIVCKWAPCLKRSSSWKQLYLNFRQQLQFMPELIWTSV